MANPEISSNERVKIDSKEQLRSELGITSPMDIPEISLSFEVTRKDLEDFKKSLDTLPTQQQLEKIKAFITEKSEVISTTKDKADAFKKTLTIGGVGAIFTGMWATLKEGMADFQNAEGLDMLDKGSSLWDKMEKMWDKAKFAIAQTKFGKMFLEFFGFDIPSVESVMEGYGEKWKDAFEKWNPLTEEKKKEIEEKLFGTLSVDMKKQYGLNVEEKLSDGTTKGDKLRAILKKRVQWLHDTFIDTEGNFIIKPIKDIYAILDTGRGIIYDLFTEWVLDSSSMTFDFVNTAKGTVRYVVKSVSGIELPQGLGGEISLDSVTENMTASEKMFLLAVFYRKGGFVTSVLWDMAYILSQPMRLLNSFDNIGTLSVRVPGFENKIQKMDQIIEMLGKIAPEKTADIEALKEMRDTAKGTKEAIETVIKYKEEAKNLKWDEWKLKELYKKTQEKLSKLKGTYPPLSWEKKLAGQALGFDAFNKAYLKDVFVTNNVNYIESLSDSINPKKIKVFAKIKAYREFLEIPGDINRTAMYFKTPEDFKGFMKELWVLASQTPEALKWLFSHLPVFIIGGMTIYKGMKPDGDIMKSLPYLFPIIGPILMLNESAVKIDHQTGKMTTEGVAEGIAWAALLWIDGLTLIKLASSEWLALWAGKLLIKPVVDTTRAIGSLVKFSWSMGKVVADGAKLGARYIGRFPSYGKVASWILAGVALLVITGEALASDSPEDVQKKLIENWLLNIDGTPNLLHMKERFKALSPENKKQILDLVFALEISPFAIDQYIESTEYTNGMYIIKTKKEYKTMIEKTLLATNIYSEFELVDNIRVETIGE